MTTPLAPVRPDEAILFTYPGALKMGGLLAFDPEATAAQRQRSLRILNQVLSLARQRGFHGAERLRALLADPTVRDPREEDALIAQVTAVVSFDEFLGLLGLAGQAGGAA